MICGEGGVEGGGEGGEGGALGIMPNEAKVGILRAQVFTASSDVSWSVMEGTAGGSVDDKGKYIAPDKPGRLSRRRDEQGGATVTSASTVTVVPLGVNVMVGKAGGRRQHRRIRHARASP